MVGKGKSYPKRAGNIDWSKRETVLEVKVLSLPKKGGGWFIDKVHFQLKKGVMLCIF